MAETKDAIEELVYFVMHVLPGIQSWGQSERTLTGILNTFFREDSMRDYLQKNEVMLSTFGIDVNSCEEVIVEHLDDYLIIRFEKGTWAADDGSSPG